MFQEKVRTDDAVRRKAAAKNLADRHAGQVLGYLRSADSIVHPRLLLEQRWLVKQKAVYNRAGWGLLMRSIMQKEVHFVHARIQPRPAIHRLLLDELLQTPNPALLYTAF